MKLLVILLSMVIFGACCEQDNGTDPVIPDSGDYQIEVKYDSLRSYAGGMGVFLLRIIPESDFQGSVKVSVDSIEGISLSLSADELTTTNNVLEIVFNSFERLESDIYFINLHFYHNGVFKTKQLKINIYMWEDCNREEVFGKLWDFKDWMVERDPALEGAFDPEAEFWATYPEILIVTHVSFLNKYYEVRLCYHVMIEPHDWSMICLRRRGEWEPFLAAKLYTDGSISEIPIAEYPEFK